jgi:hypothetical protein
MYYILIDFKYTTIDFHGDNECKKHDYLLYFYNTSDECELKYKNVKKDLLDKYNAYGEKAYEIVGEHCVELRLDDIDYTIDIVEESLL